MAVSIGYGACFRRYFLLSILFVFLLYKYLKHKYAKCNILKPLATEGLLLQVFMCYICITAV